MISTYERVLEKILIKCRFKSYWVLCLSLSEDFLSKDLAVWKPDSSKGESLVSSCS